MVKADGYGLGMEDVVQALESEDPWGFGVATVEEGIRLRTAGVKTPVIIFSPVPPGSYEPAVAHGQPPAADTAGNSTHPCAETYRQSIHQSECAKYSRIA